MATVERQVSREPAPSMQDEVIWRPGERFSPKAVSRILRCNASRAARPQGTVYIWRIPVAPGTTPWRLELFPDTAVVRLCFPRDEFDYEAREYRVSDSGVRVRQTEGGQRLFIPYCEPSRIGVLELGRGGVFGERCSGPQAPIEELQACSGKPVEVQRLGVQDLVPIRSVADLLGIPESTLRYFCRNERVKAVKVGITWLIAKDAIIELQQPGRFRRLHRDSPTPNTPRPPSQAATA